MNLLDYILILLLGFCLVRGIFRGLIKELSSIVGVLGGFYAAYTYYPMVAKWVAPWMRNAAYANIIGFITIFIGVCVVVSIVAALLKFVMKITLLGWADRIGGALAGTVKGAIIVIAMLLMLIIFLPANAPILKHSIAAHHFIKASEPLADIASKEMKSIIIVKMKELNQSWKQKQ